MCLKRKAAGNQQTVAVISSENRKTFWKEKRVGGGGKLVLRLLFQEKIPKVMGYLWNASDF